MRQAGKNIHQKIRDLSCAFKSSILIAINNINMNFFFSYLPIFTPNTAQVQYIPVSQQSLLQNTYQSQNFLYQSSHAKEQNNLILTSNITTLDSLNGATPQKAVGTKKKTPAKKEKDQNFGWRIQNKDRNIMSNILKAFVNHVHEDIGMRPYIEGLFAKLHLQNNVSDFYLFFKKQFPVSKSHVRTKLVKDMLRDDSLPQDLVRVLKLALNQFFKVNFPLILLKSTKIKRKSKLDQMKKARDLLQCLFLE